MIRVGSDFSGVGAFEQALKRLDINYQSVFACDIDKYARLTFLDNHDQPEYYPNDVYDREIPEQPLDIYMTSPPCQAFSMAGKRKGEDDARGILFYNSHEFIKNNNPRFFIFENVKGLLSDSKGKTFQKWLDYLGGKSVNGNPVIFPHPESVPYHIYHQVLNAKHYGIPQNRERVFIIGIRDDKDNHFRFPKPFPLKKKLKDILEVDVDEKYYLSDKMIQMFVNHKKEQDEKGYGFGWQPKEKNDKYANSITTKSGSQANDNYIKIKTNTKKGFEIAQEGDSINFSQPNSETRRGRVGKGVSQTLETQCNQGVLIGDYRSDEGLRIRSDNCSPSLLASMSDDYRTNYTQKKPPIVLNHRIRRLTPRECFRLMDFPDTFKLDQVRDTQKYKQAGNSICVGVLCELIKKLRL